MGGEYPIWLVDTAIVWPVLAFAFAGLVWFLRRELRLWRESVIDQIKDSTKQIQPGANGGLSLPDVFTRFDQQDQAMTDLTRMVLEHVTDKDAHA